MLIKGLNLWGDVARALDDAAAAAAAAAGGAGAGGGGGSDAAAAGTGASAANPSGLIAQAKSGEGAAADAPKVYHPEGLAEPFRGKTDQETIDKLAKHLGELPKAPEKPDGYTFEPGDHTKGRIDPAQDKVLPLFREVAHEAGLTQQQFSNVVEKFYGKLIETGMMKSQVDVQKEFAVLGGPGDPSAQRQKGAERIMQLDTTVDGLVTRGLLTKDDAEGIKADLGSTARSVIALEKLIAQIPQAGSGGAPANGGAPGGDGKTDHERSIERMYPTMIIK